MRNKITCFVTGAELTDPNEVIIITSVPPTGVEKADELLRQKVSTQVYVATLRKAGFRGFNLGKARAQRQARERQVACATVAELLAAKGQSLKAVP